MSKYVRVEDVMNFINTPNRGNCDFFIIDQIEELCKSNKVYDVEKVVDSVRADCYTMGFDESKTEIIVADIRKGGVEC